MKTAVAQAQPRRLALLAGIAALALLAVPGARSAGNAITPEAQRAKLALLVRVAQDVLGP